MWWIGSRRPEDVLSRIHKFTSARKTFFEGMGHCLQKVIVSLKKIIGKSNSLLGVPFLHVMKELQLVRFHLQIFFDDSLNMRFRIPRKSTAVSDRDRWVISNNIFDSFYFVFFIGFVAKSCVPAWQDRTLGIKLL